MKIFKIASNPGFLREIEDDAERWREIERRNRLAAEHRSDFDIPIYNVWKQQNKTVASGCYAEGVAGGRPEADVRSGSPCPLLHKTFMVRIGRRPLSVGRSTRSRCPRSRLSTSQHRQSPP
jgi:hypothetical protein